MNREPVFDYADLQRINLVGTSACGKSTLGKQLAEILDAPYIEMDSLYHEPNWKEAELEVFRQRLTDATAPEEWVLDGNYHSKTYDIKWARATMIVWLDIPFSVNIYRAVCRAVNRAWTQKELWPETGNRESFRQTFFSKDSMILWTATSYWRLKKRYAAIQDSPPDGVHFVRLSSPAAVQEFMQRVADVVREESQPSPASQ